MRVERLHAQARPWARTGTIGTRTALISMPQHSGDSARARAEALFKRREEQKADAPAAMAEYRAAQRAALERMYELRRLRLARQAEGDLG